MFIKNTILCIDDDPFVLDYLKIKLGEGKGYKILTASDAKTGIKMAHEHKPKIILLDWMLPDRSGLSVLDALCGDSRTTWIPIFMLTGRSKMVDMEIALERGAEGFFTKPAKLDQICHRIDSFLKAA